MKVRYLYIYLILAAFTLFESCYKDDLEDCPILLHVYCRSVMEKYSYENITDKLDLYLYNQSGAFVEKYSYTRQELAQADYNALIEIWNFGDYTLLASVNALQPYLVTGTENLNAFKVGLIAEANDTVRNKPNDLYHGHKAMALPFTGIINRYDTLDIYKNTNHIDVNISFENSSVPDELVLTPLMHGNNGSFDYSNKCHPDSRRIYLPHTRQDMQDGIQLQFTTMQLRIGSDLTFMLYEDFKGEKKIAHEFNLMEMIAKNPKYDTDEELDQEDHFRITLVYKSDYGILELKVNDWYVIRQGVMI